MSTTAIPTGEQPAEAPVTPEPQPAEPVAQTAVARKIFKYSEFVHVGEGAEECPVAAWLVMEERPEEMPACEDPTHFHAWCRLPNKYQQEDIRAKAMAAKARRVRDLKDPESDLAVVMEAELEPLRDDRFRESLIDELIGEEMLDDYSEAQKDVREREEYEHITQDQEEFQRLRDHEGELPEDEQSDEYKRLRDHVQGYLTAITERLKEVQEPKRENLRERPLEGLIEAVRAKRIDEEAVGAFMSIYNAWTCYVGTFKPDLHETLKKPYKPMWDDIGHRDRAETGTMFGEDPDVIPQLQEVFSRLRESFNAGSRGN